MNYNPFNKKLAELTKEDIETLITKEIAESWFVEYKYQIPGNSDKLDNLKIAKSVAAFANSKGGWIFWGISCDSKKNKPTKIVGIDISRYRNFEDQIAQVLNANISPQPYYHFKQIEIDNDLIVFVIQVEESPAPPYITSESYIYQRENNESKPIKDRYSLERLHDKAKKYNDSIEAFCSKSLINLNDGIIGNESYLELFIIPIPFNYQQFTEFYSSEFFDFVDGKFREGISLEINDTDRLPIGLGFNSVHSSEGSVILRRFDCDAETYDALSVELFENTALKFTCSLEEIDIQSFIKRSTHKESVDFMRKTFSKSLKAFGKKGAKNDKSLRVIDGVDIIVVLLILLAKYTDVLKEYTSASEKFGFRARVKNVHGKFIYFEHDDYLSKLMQYNIPICPKDTVEIPAFADGKAYRFDPFEAGAYSRVSQHIMEAIGLPNPSSIAFEKIIKDNMETYISRSAR